MEVKHLFLQFTVLPDIQVATFSSVTWIMITFQNAFRRGEENMLNTT